MTVVNRSELLELEVVVIGAPFIWFVLVEVLLVEIEEVFRFLHQLLLLFWLCYFHHLLSWLWLCLEFLPTKLIIIGQFDPLVQEGLLQ